MEREIIPVILAKDVADFKKKLAVIQALRPAPRWIQIDVVDGKFAPYKTWDNPKKAMAMLSPSPSPLPRVERVNIEVDLMVVNPLQHARAWIKTGAKRILFHVEASTRFRYRVTGNLLLGNSVWQIIKYIKSHGVEVGLSLNPDTPIEMLKPFLPPTSPPPTSWGGKRRGMIDCVLLLGVNPGKSGQKFQKKILAKIRALRKAAPRLPIEVDGGVNLKNARAILRAGATRLAAASAIVNAKNPQEAWKKLSKIGNAHI